MLKIYPWGLSIARKYLVEKTGCKKQPDISLKCARAVAHPPSKGKSLYLFPRTKKQGPYSTKTLAEGRKQYKIT